MLLLHGTGASTHSWRDMVPYLAQRYTLVMPDLPGHAFSTLHAHHPPSLPHMSEDLRRLLAKLDPVPYTHLTPPPTRKGSFLLVAASLQNTQIIAGFGAFEYT